MFRYLNKFNIFYQHQYGFRPNKHYTNRLLLNLMKKINENLSKSKPKFTLTIFLDLRILLKNQLPAFSLAERTYYAVPELQLGKRRCVQLRCVTKHSRGSKNCTQIKTKLHLRLGSLKEEFNPSWEYKPCTMIPVFYSTRCEDWTAMEDTSQQSFQGHNSPFCIWGAVMGKFLNSPNWETV